MHLSDIVAGQKEFSEKTFGPGTRAKGVLDHIRKELKEIEEAIEAGEDPLEEWIDVMILAADGAWRSDHTADEVEDAYLDKLRRNILRQWPDWRTSATDKAIEHIR